MKKYKNYSCKNLYSRFCFVFCILCFVFSVLCFVFIFQILLEMYYFKRDFINYL